MLIQLKKIYSILVNNIKLLPTTAPIQKLILAETTVFNNEKSILLHYLTKPCDALEMPRFFMMERHSYLETYMFNEKLQNSIPQKSEVIKNKLKI